MATGFVVFALLAAVVILAVKSKGKYKLPPIRGTKDTDGNGKNP